ncbi:MAG TPA: hypothetical protein VNA30_00170 [Mycobacteriales bacterium]|nr:hypothetical protein [Mycobacteriales bacterium]
MRRRPLALPAALAVLGMLALAASAAAGVTAPRPSATVPSYTNYPTTTKASPPPSELGYDAPEPSIGVNHKTGKVMYQAYLQTLQATFDDGSVPAKMSVKDVTNPIEGVVTLDPFMFTDSVTGRTFVSQLAPPCSISSFTDTDGEPTVPGLPGSGYTTSTGCGVGANADHQAFSAGPAPAGLPTTYGPNRVVYYCSQMVVQATCARSLDGGVTFPQSAVMYTLDAVKPGCAGLHGHLRIAPDGTAYMPNYRCTPSDGPPRAALVVADPSSVLRFEIRPLPTSTTSADYDSDPAVGVDSAGTAYVAWEDAQNNMMVAVTKDRAKTFTNITDIGAPFKIKNGTMPKVVAGSAGRAAVAFLGTPTEAPKDKRGFRENNLRSFDPDQGDPKQGWHLYISTTYDSGKSWVTVDATPTDPVQRGCIYWGGSQNVPEGDRSCTQSRDRNLLDFIDVTVDKTGRVLVGYADGCVAACATDANSEAKDDNATIARQTCGRGLFADYDARPDGPMRTCAAAVSSGTRLPRNPSGRVADSGRSVVLART